MSDTLPPDLRDILIRIDTRLGGIVADIAELKTDARKTREEITKTREEMAFMRGLLQNIPTYWETTTIVLGVLVGLPVIAGIAVWLLHLAGKL